MDFAAGDSCFYIGLSGKEHASGPTFEPYQCCRASEKKYANNNNEQNGRYARRDKMAIGADSKGKNKPENDYAKVKSSFVDKQDKPIKAKKGGVLGNGNEKYIWWW